MLLALASLLGVTSAAQAACNSTPLKDPRSARWIDFSDRTVPWREELFGHKNITVAIADSHSAAALRAKGAQTVFWEMNLYKLIGTPDKPLSRPVVKRLAANLLKRAQNSTATENPIIALNEMLSPRSPRPFSKKETRYRENILILVESVCAGDGNPWLLIPSPPRTDGLSLKWWKKVGENSGVVQEVYFKGPEVLKYGRRAGERLLRAKLRQAAYRLAQIKVPRAHQGLMVGFQSGGIYGRNGLASKSAWLEFVAMKEATATTVAKEHGIATLWSWGWGTYNLRGADPDKPIAACVYLWMRAPGFCAGPKRSGGNVHFYQKQLFQSTPASLRCFYSNKQTPWGIVERARTLSTNPVVIANALGSEAALRRRFPLTRMQVAASINWFARNAPARSPLLRLRRQMSRGLYLFTYADALRRDKARKFYGQRYDSWIHQETIAHWHWLGCSSALKVEPVSLLSLAVLRLER